MWSEACQIMLLESENVKQAFEEQDIWVQCNLQYRQYHKKKLCIHILHWVFPVYIKGMSKLFTRDI